MRREGSVGACRTIAPAAVGGGTRSGMDPNLPEPVAEAGLEDRAIDCPLGVDVFLFLGLFGASRAHAVPARPERLGFLRKGRIFIDRRPRLASAFPLHRGVARFVPIPRLTDGKFRLGPGPCQREHPQNGLVPVSSLPLAALCLRHPAGHRRLPGRRLIPGPQIFPLYRVQHGANFKGLYTVFPRAAIEFGAVSRQSRVTPSRRAHDTAISRRRVMRE